MRRPVFWRAEQLHVLPSPPHRLGKCCGNHEMQRALVNKGRYQVHLCQLTLSECQDVSSIDQIEDPTGVWISTPQYNSADWLYEGSKGLGANLFKWTVALEVKELDTARHVASAVCTCGVAPEDGTSVPPMSYAASHNTCGVGPALAQGRHPQGSLTETKTYVLRPYHSQSHDGFGTLL